MSQPKIDQATAPGSDAARALGCICPVIDNNRGRGYMGMEGVYVIRGDCPLHHPALPPSDPPARADRAAGQE